MPYQLTSKAFGLLPIKAHTGKIKHDQVPEQTSQQSTSQSTTANIQDYYAEASEGYQDWSKALNMHFGVYQWGTNPLDLEAMLENTNQLVIEQLGLTGQRNKILDMGCGLGGTARYAANLEEVHKVCGVTIAKNQVTEAQSLSANHPCLHKLHFLHANYHRTPFVDQSFDGIYAIESACHSEEHNKATLLKEAYRLLKPNANIVICDGFIKNKTAMNRLTRHCYKQTCTHWALGNFPELSNVTRTMSDLGFQNVQVKNVSWRVLPSALYIPWMVIKYGAKLLRRNDKNPQHWHHLFAPLWGLGLACNLKQFGYYVVTATKPSQNHNSNNGAA